MNKKEFIENIITEDWRQIRIDNMLIEKIVEHEMFLDQLINSVRAETRKIELEVHRAVLEQHEADVRVEVKEECAKIVMKYKDILLENRKEIAKAIRDKE